MLRVYVLRCSIFKIHGTFTWRKVSDCQTVSASYMRVYEVLRTNVWKQTSEPRTVKKYFGTLRWNNPNSSAISRELL
jgi:hypothetical protein